MASMVLQTTEEQGPQGNNSSTWVGHSLQVCLDALAALPELIQPTLSALLNVNMESHGGSVGHARLTAKALIGILLENRLRTQVARLEQFCRQVHADLMSRLQSASMFDPAIVAQLNDTMHEVFGPLHRV